MVTRTRVRAHHADNPVELPSVDRIGSHRDVGGRANLRRLDFEAIRDSILTFTGKLDPTIGGKPVNLTDEPYSNRRSVYGYIDRGDLPELMSQFDFADPDMANSARTTTIVPQQALFFMNSPMAVLRVKNQARANTMATMYREKGKMIQPCPMKAYGS